MSFYICLALAVIVTITGIIYYRRNKDAVGMPESPFRVLLLIALADTCILYIPWFIHLWYADSINRGREIFFLPFMIVRLMQTVSLDADYEAALEMVGFAKSSGVSVFFLQAYAVLLSYVSVLVPLSGILTIMSFFRNRIGYRFAASRLSGKRNVYIFNGVSERNMELAASICRRAGHAKRDTAFLYCNVREEPSAEVKRKISETKGWYTPDYPSALLQLVLFRRDRKLNFFLLEDERRNFNDAINILKEAGKRCGDVEKWEIADNVSVHLVLESNELASILDVQKKYGIFVRIMDVEQMYVQDLFKRLPPFSCLRPGKKEMRLVIYGQGRVAQAALMEALWMGCIASASLKVWYISEEAEEVRSKLKILCPALFDPALAGGERFDLCFEAITESGQLYRIVGEETPSGEFAESGSLTGAVIEESLAEEPATKQAGLQRADFLGADYVILAGESDEENIRTAMWFRTWFARQIPEDEPQPLIAVCVRDEKRAEQAENLCIQESKAPYDLHVFGTEARLFTAENILYGKLADSLYRIQLFYSLSDPFGQATPEQKSDAWMALNQSIYNYRSSEASALYIVNRLYDSGAILECMRKKAGDPDGMRTDAGDPDGIRTKAGYPSGEFRGLEQALFWTDAVARNVRDGDRAVLDEILDVYEQKIAEPEMFELLSRTEHRRWIAYMACSGWVALPKEKLREWMKSSGGNHKDYLRLRHACMAGWDELGEMSLIKTDGKDAEKFKDLDRMIVRGVRSFIV